MTEPQPPAYGIVAQRLNEINPDAHIARVVPFPDNGTFVFQLQAGDRTCEVEISEEFLEDLRDYSGSKASDYWQGKERALTEKVVAPMERSGVIPYTKETLKKAIFEHVKAETQKGGQINKFNLVGRPYQRGSLEGFLKVAFREDERHAAALAFDELRKQGLLIPTYTDMVNPEDWVKAGKQPSAEPGENQPAERERRVAQVTEAMAHPDGSKVFVIHGRNKPAYNAVCDFLKAIGLEPLDWDYARAATNKATPYVLEVVEKALKESGAVVALFTPDDLASLKPEFQRASDPGYEKEPTGQARPNVLLETGMALARFGQRVVLVQIGSTRPLSDLEGLHFLRLDNTEQRRKGLVASLRTAGCPVRNLDGGEWLKAGDFEGCLQGGPLESASPEDKDILQQYEKAISEIPKNYNFGPQ